MTMIILFSASHDVNTSWGDVITQSFISPCTDKRYIDLVLNFVFTVWSQGLPSQELHKAKYSCSAYF